MLLWQRRAVTAQRAARGRRAVAPTTGLRPLYVGRLAWNGHRGARTAGSAAAEAPAAEADARHGERAGAVAPAPNDGLAAEGREFSWRRQWWPIAVEDNLEASKPNAAMLLGEPLVVWRDGEGVWSVLEDRCPHRLAPLSEGRIDASGHLMCSYHGWQFDAAGTCVDIPQLEDPRARATACASARASARAYHCQVEAGLLWVWADPESPPPPGAAPAVAEELRREGWSLLGAGWFQRDLEYSYDVMCENLFDPSHIPFAHHKIMGNARRELATPLGEIKTTRPIGPSGFQLWRDTAPFRIPRRMETVNDFVPPALVSSVQTSDNGGTFMLQFYGVPTAPGKSRIFAGFVSNMKLPAAAVALSKRLEWLGHLSQQVVLDSDAYLLHVQERLLQRSRGGWRRSFYLPASADTGVIAFRTWYDDVGGGSIPWPEGVSPDPGPILPREVVMDRYAQHVKGCKACRGAVAWIERLRTACTAVATVAAPVGVFALIQAAGAMSSSAAAAAAAGQIWMGVPLGAGMLLLAAAALLARNGLQALWWRFHFTDYVHSQVR